MQLSMTVDQFCQANSICRATFYQLLKDGDGPLIMKVGRRTLVSIEAAEAWRRRMEAKARVAPQVAQQEFTR